MVGGDFCMGSYQEVYVGGDNGCHWRRHGRCTLRSVYGGARVMRPEYMVKEHQRTGNSNWQSCGGNNNCFRGYSRESVYLKLTGSATGGYLKGALDIALKCTEKEAILVQVEDVANKFYSPGASHVVGWNTNAKLELFYNQQDITSTMFNKARWGFQEYMLYSMPGDKDPVLRMEVSRVNANAEAIFRANVIVHKARVSVDSCMTDKADRAQCLEKLEKSHPTTSLRSSHSEQAACVKHGNGGDAACAQWKSCLSSDAKDMIQTVDDAFGYQAPKLMQVTQDQTADKAQLDSREASLLQVRQNLTTGNPAQSDSRCTADPYAQLKDCKCGYHGTCLDPYSMDIEALACRCLQDIADMNKQDLRKHLCGRPDICCDWKISEGCTDRTYWRGGSVARSPCSCPPKAILTETAETDHVENNISKRSHTEGDSSTVSLDESLSGKRC